MVTPYSRSAISMVLRSMTLCRRLPGGEAMTAEIMGITAQRLKTLGLIDKIISEPVGGAHRDCPATMQSVGKVLQESLKQLQGYSTEILLQKRFGRLMDYGKFKEVEVK